MDAPTQKARRYASSKLRLSLISGAVELALLLAFLISGASRGLAHWLTGTPALVVLYYVLLVGAAFKLIELPWSWVGRRIEIAYGMNRQGAGSWWADEDKGTLLGLIVGLGAAELVYWLLRAAPRHWWWWAWGAFTLLTVLLAQLGPVLLLPLFFKMRPMSEDNERDAPLVRRLHAT